MHWIDWLIIGCFILSMMFIGLMFSSKAGDSIDSYFVSGRTLKWYVAGASLIATSFAADTPLWISSLVRQYGVHAAWQYWAPLIGSALGVVLFSKMWRRTGVVTDNEIIELRYSGKSAQTMRAISGFFGALIICPLIIGWVSNAMVTISQETLGLTETIHFLGMSLEAKEIATIVVMACALVLCALSGLFGVVYTDFIQFIIATAGTFILAALAVQEVGGLSAMYEKLTNHPTWAGASLSIAPEITTQPGSENANGAMSIWNFIGYFGILWWGVALSGGYNAQRILACKDSNHASKAMLLHTIVYYAVVSLPWIIVALASIIIFPDLAEHDKAYPKMILHVLPVGLKGMVIAALIAAFISTLSTLFNWGSSYMVNDIYRRFIKQDAPKKHYVSMSRILTVFLAILGGIIALAADNIQQLQEIFFVFGCGGAVVGVARWMWWRVTAASELIAFVGNWFIAGLMLFTHKIEFFGLAQPLFDPVMNTILAIPEGMSFTQDYDFLGARMLFMSLVALVIVVIGSFITKPTDIEQLKEFCSRTKIFNLGWKHVTDQIPNYKTAHPVGTVILDWFLVMATVIILLFAMNSIVLCNPTLTIGLFVGFAVLLFVVIKRTKADTVANIDDEAV